MFVSLILILLLTAGGLSLTYLIAEDEPLLWRVCGGNVIGSAIFGLVCFLLACFFGFSATTISVSFLITLTPLILFAQKPTRLKLKNDWQKAKGKLEGASGKKLLRFAYYVFFFIVFYFFFERAMIETAQGIFTGASQNYGDLPFHLGAIFSFTEGNNFPPENPSYAFAKFSYPFIADLITAAFVKFGASVSSAMLIQNVSLAFSLLVVLERFVFKLTGNRLAAKIAPVLLFFSGGLGFLWFLKDYWQGAQGLTDFFWNLPRDYTITNGDKSEVFRWGNSLVVIFVTQRSLLLGMPLTVIILQKLWEIFIGGEETEVKNRKDKEIHIVRHPLSAFQCFYVGLFAGTLPLIHVHSLAVLFVVTAFLFFYRLDKWREWLWFGAGVGLIAVPELVWVMTGTATHLKEFIGWNFGWDKQKENFFWFWFKNTGFFIPILILGIVLIYLPTIKRENADEEKAELNDDDNKRINLLLFYLPFLLCFLVSNVVKLAPWEWDNIKILIYWFVGSLPVVALVLAWAWNKDKILKIIAVACLIVLTFSGALDVWRTISEKIYNNVFNRDSVAVAEQIKQKTAPNAMFLNAPTFNSAIVLSGRRSLMRYVGHLSSYGIYYYEREADVKRIYAGDAAATALLNKYNIEYVLISPEERSYFQTGKSPLNEDFFRRFPVAAQVGEYTVYQIKK